jgi:putative FmdB family regulatory protein
MPIYEYLCQACNHELEIIQKLSDKQLKVCPECKRAKLKKKLTTSAFRLGGKGWYETDFKTGDKKNIAGDNNKVGSTDGGEATAGAGGGADNKAATTASDKAAADKSKAEPQVKSKPTAA